jgi:hypothetical protein
MLPKAHLAALPDCDDVALLYVHLVVDPDAVDKDAVFVLVVGQGGEQPPVFASSLRARGGYRGMPPGDPVPSEDLCKGKDPR